MDWAGAGAATLLAPCAFAGEGCNTPMHAISTPAIHTLLLRIRVIS
jgi:hypothetical protein